MDLEAEGVELGEGVMNRFSMIGMIAADPGANGVGEEAAGRTSHSLKLVLSSTEPEMKSVPLAVESGGRTGVGKLAL